MRVASRGPANCRSNYMRGSVAGSCCCANAGRGKRHDAAANSFVYLIFVLLCCAVGHPGGGMCLTFPPSWRHFETVNCAVCGQIPRISAHHRLATAPPLRRRQVLTLLEPCRKRFGSAVDGGSAPPNAAGIGMGGGPQLSN